MLAEMTATLAFSLGYCLRFDHRMERLQAESGNASEPVSPGRMDANT
ncbi:hypothetical protein [Methyloterricola oryzae]|nr:hypothetical protein [Methyloterricola oryzae]